MDVDILSKKIGMEDCKGVTKKAKELLRLCTIRFEGGLGVAESCKTVACLELACSELQVTFDRKKAIRLSGSSEKMYTKALQTVQNALGIRPRIDTRQLAVQFGCVRLIAAVHRAIDLYKQRFIASLPVTRRGSADFGRSVFIAAAFYLTARKHQLKVDKAKLIQTVGISELEFANVSTSMLDLCFDILGVQKKKRPAETIKGNRALLDAIPKKRKREELEEEDEEKNNGEDDDDEEEQEDYVDGLDEEGGLVVPGVKKSARKVAEESYKGWKATVIASNKQSVATPDDDAERPKKVMKQSVLSFGQPKEQIRVIAPSSIEAA